MEMTVQYTGELHAAWLLKCACVCVCVYTRCVHVSVRYAYAKRESARTSSDVCLFLADQLTFLSSPELKAAGLLTLEFVASRRRRLKSSRSAVAVLSHQTRRSLLGLQQPQLARGKASHKLASERKTRASNE